MLRRTIILICVAAGFFFQGCKEDTIEPQLIGSISGQVIDHESNSPIPGASITTSPPTGAILSGPDGNFVIQECNVGNYTISAVKNGYEKGSVTISVSEARETKAILFLKKNSSVLPHKPENPTPGNAAVNQPVSVLLSWQSKSNDGLFTYDIYFYKSNKPESEPLAENCADTTYEIKDLDYSTTYFWQVAAKDTGGNKVFSEVWNFTTRDFPDNPIFYSSFINNYEIVSSDTLSNEKIQLTYNASKDWWVRANKFRNKIAFISDHGSDNQIFISDMNGKNVQQVTSLPVAGYHNNGMGFCWSSNGEYILYGHYDKLYRIRYDGTELRVIATAPNGRHFRECAWSLNMDKIAVLTIGVNPFDSEIYLANSDGTNMQILVQNLPGAIGGLDFSIDGKSILFSHDVSGNESIDGRELDTRLKSIIIQDSSIIDLSYNKIDGTNDFHPQYSPDGSKIIFTNVPNDYSQQPAIWMMDADGQNRRQLFANGLMADWK